MYYTSVLADSLSPEGVRLTTFEIRLPRIVLAEFNTHRMLSRNSASSRAVPISVTVQGVQDDPFFPASFGGHQTGMQAAPAITDQDAARDIWEAALEDAVGHAIAMEALGVYKGLANRLIEPFKWHTIIATATDWSNYFALRTDKNAQDEIRIVSEMMQQCYYESIPRKLGYGEYHLPLVSFMEIATRLDPPDYDYWVPVSIGRCARVSFERQHDDDVDKALAIHAMLEKNRHLSPFEHVARPFSAEEWDLISRAEIYTFKDHLRPFAANLNRGLEYAGNLRGWWGARMDIPDQDDYGKVLASSS
jgi:thymidylate synthase ThyX